MLKFQFAQVSSEVYSLDTGYDFPAFWAETSTGVEYFVVKCSREYDVSILEQWLVGIEGGDFRHDEKDRVSRLARQVFRAWAKGKISILPGRAGDPDDPDSYGCPFWVNLGTPGTGNPFWVDPIERGSFLWFDEDYQNWVTKQLRGREIIKSNGRVGFMKSETTRRRSSRAQFRAMS